MASCRRSTDDTATTPSIKVEPTEGERPLTVRPPLPHNESTNQSTVKCEWSLKESCVCADEQCEDCQASELEDEKDGTSLTTFAAASPLNNLETDETEFHPPIWEDCDEAEDTDNASDAENEDGTQVVETIDGILGDGPMIEQVNPGEIFPLSPRNQNAKNEPNSNQLSSIIQQANTEQNNEVIANNEMNENVNTERESDDEEEVAGQAEATLSSLSLRRSPRVQKRPINYAVLPEAEEEEVFQDDPNTGTSDTEESDSDQSETDSKMETDDDPSETEERSPIAANGNSEGHSQKSFPCGQCGKRFAARWNLHRHEATLHRQILPSRPHLCSAPACGKTFEYQSHLDRHCLLHSGLRPFICSTCGAAFNRQSNLNFHQRSHRDARPYVCTVCKMAFKRKQTLVRHNLVVHSSEQMAKQSFPCPDCGGSFTQKGSLKRHSRQFHSI